MSKSIQYRPDVDGLRTVAVASVIFFHFEVPYFSGGYVGVDVFFVISGFLISSILFAELESQRFSILGFYERRARRILPALFFALAGTVLAACLLMLPNDVAEVGESVLATLAFIANFYFWQSSGYFAGAADTQPLLHMWSLAVEEQFYIFFPPFLWLCFRRPRLLLPLLFWIIAFSSLLISIYGSVYYPNPSYFLPITRAWELMVGAVIARPGLLLPFLNRLESPLIKNTLSLVGLACVVAPIFILTPDSTFPGVNAIYPVLGTALIIWSGQSCRTPVVWLLSFRPVVWMGLLSYSLYLWHWPVWVFSGEVAFFDRHEPLEKIGLMVFSVFLAFISWRFVEAPFRRQSSASASRTFVLSASGGVVFFAFGLVLALLPQSASLTKLNDAELSLLSYEDYLDNRQFPNAECWVRRHASWPVQNCPAQSGPTDLLIWGDSFAGHLVPGILASLTDGELLQVTSGGCPPVFYVEANSAKANCREFSELARQSIAELKPKKVIVAARWPRYDGRRGIVLEHEVAASLEFLTQVGVSEVLFIGNLPTWEGTFPRRVFDVSSGGTIADSIPLTSAEYREDLDEVLMSIVLKEDMKFVQMSKALCPDGACPVFASNGEILQWDSGHLTVGGSIDVVKRSFGPDLQSIP